ncbi:MAG: HDOD domain-containing protein [Deltaproteobacteria bacterium]|nr:HDOD domain-containing protein [Deltaproteobacteria bacterium]
MIFKGELSNFQPPNLLQFLDYLGKEGVLTIVNQGEVLSISLADGMVADAHSNRSDKKVLRTLLIRRFIDKDQFKLIDNAVKETGMPLRHVLAHFELVSILSHNDIFLDGVREATWQFFLCDTGQFNFNSIIISEITFLRSLEQQNLAPVEREMIQQQLNCQNLSMEISAQVDEWRETVRSLRSLDRVLTVTSLGLAAKLVDPIERVVQALTDGHKTIARIIELSPFSSYRTLNVIERFVDRGWVVFKEDKPQESHRALPAGPPPLFFAFKRSFKKIHTASDSNEKMVELLAFCKDNFDQTLALVVEQGLITRIKGFYKDAQRQLQRIDVAGVHFDLKEDPVFSWVYQSGRPFIGQVFISDLTTSISHLPLEGECAVILLEKKDKLSVLVYVVSRQKMGGLGPFHYLELLSWLVNPIKGDPCAATWPPPRIIEGPAKESPYAPSPESSPQDRAELIVKAVEDIFPVPNVAGQMINLLSDPNASADELARTLSYDQSLVARLIKVSNSSLYGSSREIKTLRAAVIRLGNQIIKSLVWVSSIRGLFPAGASPNGILGQALWRHAKECGLASRRVAQAVRYGDPEEAFVNGLLHDMGKLLITIYMPEEFRAALKKQNTAKMRGYEAEREVLGFDHMIVGEMVMKKWNMPESLTACVRYHHHPKNISDFSVLSSIICCGDYLGHTQGSRSDLTPIDDVISIESALEILNLDENKMNMLAMTVADDFQHTDVLD